VRPQLDELEAGLNEINHASSQLDFFGHNLNDRAHSWQASQIHYRNTHILMVINDITKQNRKKAVKFSVKGCTNETSDYKMYFSLVELV